MPLLRKQQNFSQQYTIRTLNEIINVGVASRLVYEGSACDAYPCWNNGVCVQRQNKTINSSRGYACICNEFYSGEHCQNKIENNCSKHFCAFGEICDRKSLSCYDFIQAQNRFTNCSKMNNEFLNCQNGGNCIQVGEDRLQQKCACPESFHGMFCELMLNVPDNVHLNLSTIHESSRVAISSKTLNIGFNEPSFTYDNFSLQPTLSILAVLIFLASIFLAFFYGNVSCYLLWPKRRQNKSGKKVWKSGGKYSKMFTTKFKGISNSSSQMPLEQEFSGRALQDSTYGVIDEVSSSVSVIDDASIFFDNEDWEDVLYGANVKQYFVNSKDSNTQLIELRDNPRPSTFHITCKDENQRFTACNKNNEPIHI